MIHAKVQSKPDYYGYCAAQLIPNLSLANTLDDPMCDLSCIALKKYMKKKGKSKCCCCCCCWSDTTSASTSPANRHHLPHLRHAHHPHHRLRLNRVLAPLLLFAPARRHHHRHPHRLLRHLHRHRLPAIAAVISADQRAQGAVKAKLPRASNALAKNEKDRIADNVPTAQGDKELETDGTRDARGLLELKLIYLFTSLAFNFQAVFCLSTIVLGFTVGAGIKLFGKLYCPSN
ncbi:hypothetical protein TcWFU_009868 [Taenia crassiceps]|uniref:Copper transporter n=1 Tax=Taenia crassiceps TaxID=6207 RepID=A0ABR4QIG0_9CEST